MSLNIFKKISLVLIVIILILPATTYARNFLRNLHVGDYGDDVRFVQTVLNLAPETKVAETGSGSPGNETSYFGPATKKAIIKFQYLYSNDILKPAGLSIATGVVGSFTQKKLNELAQVYNDSHKAVQNATSSNSNAQINNTPFIESITPTTFGNGDTVVIKGKNFDSTDNTVLLSIENDGKFVRIQSPDTKNLSLMMNLTFVNGMTKGMSHLTGDTRAKAIAFLISKGKFLSGPEDGAAYMNATIQVKNKNGTSNYASVLVKILDK